MSKIKKFKDFTTKVIDKLFYNKCPKCKEEMTNYGTGGLNPEPLYVCDHCEKSKKV